MSLRYLLDTSIVSAPVAKPPNAQVLRRLEESSHECALAAPVWHELAFGVRRLPLGKRRRALESYLEDVVRASFPILAYDERAATWHAQERARLEQDGTPAPFVDGQIAAIARTNDLVLVTANARDFRRFADLELADWTRRKASR